MKKYVFISYHNDARDEALALRRALDERNISVWMAPDDIPPQREYGKAVPAAIKNCSVFLIVITDAANNSVWMPKELDMAVNMEKTVMPFILEDCELSPSLGFYLVDIPKYEAFADKNAAKNKLIEDIKRITGSKTGIFFKPWLSRGPYKRLNDKEEFLAMNTITLCSFFLAAVLFLALLAIDAPFELSLVLPLILLDLIWYTGGKLVPRIARTDNKKVIVFASVFLSLLLGVIFFLAEVVIFVFIFNSTFFRQKKTTFGWSFDFVLQKSP